MLAKEDQVAAGCFPAADSLHGSSLLLSHRSVTPKLQFLSYTLKLMSSSHALVSHQTTAGEVHRSNNMGKPEVKAPASPTLHRQTSSCPALPELR